MDKDKEIKCKYCNRWILNDFNCSCNKKWMSDKLTSWIDLGADNRTYSKDKNWQ